MRSKHLGGNAGALYNFVMSLEMDQHGLLHQGWLEPGRESEDGGTMRVGTSSGGCAKKQNGLFPVIKPSSTSPMFLIDSMKTTIRCYFCFRLAATAFRTSFPSLVRLSSLQWHELCLSSLAFISFSRTPNNGSGGLCSYWSGDRL